MSKPTGNIIVAYKFSHHHLISNHFFLKWYLLYLPFKCSNGSKMTADMLKSKKINGRSARVTRFARIKFNLQYFHRWHYWDIIWLTNFARMDWTGGNVILTNRQLWVTLWFWLLTAKSYLSYIQTNCVCITSVSRQKSNLILWEIRHRRFMSWFLWYVCHLAIRTKRLTRIFYYSFQNLSTILKWA